MSLLFSETEVAVGGQHVHVAFTSSAAGNLGLHVGDDPCSVLHNRSALESELNLLTGSFTYLKQVHGTDVVFPRREEIKAPDITLAGAQTALKEAPVADAAISLDGRPLAIMVADCIPLVLVGQKGKDAVLAVAHAGRRGLLDGIIQQTVEAMREQGSQNIRIWLGPSICGRCYEVPEIMQKESEKILPGISSTTSWGTPALDLPTTAAELARNLPGVVSVDTSLSTCTLENKDVFSHRRGDAGRIAGLIWMS